MKVRRVLLKILTAELDRFGEGELSLKLRIRLTNNEEYPVAFGVAPYSFRLLVGGVSRAPEQSDYMAVDSDSAQEGTVVFVMPDRATQVTLQVERPGASETASVRLDLRPRRP